MYLSVYTQYYDTKRGWVLCSACVLPTCASSAHSSTRFAAHSALYYGKLYGTCGVDDEYMMFPIVNPHRDQLVTTRKIRLYSLWAFTMGNILYSACPVRLSILYRPMRLIMIKAKI